MITAALIAVKRFMSKSKEELSNKKKVVANRSQFQSKSGTNIRDVGAYIHIQQHINELQMTTDLIFWYQFVFSLIIFESQF